MCTDDIKEKKLMGGSGRGVVTAVFSTLKNGRSRCKKKIIFDLL